MLKDEDKNIDIITNEEEKIADNMDFKKIKSITI